METNKIRIAITQGDTNWAGIELILKSFSEPDILELCTPVVYSSPKTVAAHGKALGLETSMNNIKSVHDAHADKLNIVSCYDEEIVPAFGTTTQESTIAALKALDQALSDYREGLVDALVCLPMADNIVSAGGYKFADQTAYIETTLGTEHKATIIYLNELMRIAMVCDDGDMNQLPKAVTAESVAAMLRIMHTSIKRDFRISNPRIAVLALNPSAAGAEEESALRPAIEEMKAKGVQAFGPYPAEQLFGQRHYAAFDGILAMYHDQAMLPLRMSTDSPAVSFLANLPIVCTMPEGDMASLAGKNQADPAALRNAIYTAIDISRFRRDYDEPFANPLPKLYHERPDNGEKLRFAIPKKKEE